MEECNHCCVDCVYYHGGNKPICSCSSVEKILLTDEEKKQWSWNKQVLGHPLNINNEEEINNCPYYKAHLELDKDEDIELETTYNFNWTCPYCGHHNAEYNYSVWDGNFECKCESCGKVVEIGAHFI